MGEHTACVLCATYHPASEPRLPRWPPACDSCRTRLHAELTDIPDAYALLPEAVEPAVGRGERVSGSKVPPIPLNVDAVDLTLPARPGSIGVRNRRAFIEIGGEKVEVDWAVYGGDPLQVGELSVATTLEFWVADWRTLGLGEHLPPPTVTTLTAWLLVRLDDALDRHPAIDEFATDINHTLRALRSAARTHTYRGEPAGKCPMKLRDDTRCAKSLFVDPYLDYITCSRCGTTWDRRRQGWVQLRSAQDEWTRTNDTEEEIDAA